MCLLVTVEKAENTCKGAIAYVLANQPLFRLRVLLLISAALILTM